MKRMMNISFAVTALSLAVAGTALADNHNNGVAEYCPGTLHMADTGIEGMGDLQTAFGPFKAEFEAITDIELALYSLSNRTAAGTALQFDELDLVFAGPAEFVLFDSLQDIDILFAIDRPHYGSSFYTKADSGITSLQDLSGERVALKDVGSTSGHIIPTQMLVDAGLDPDRDMDIFMAADARHQVLINGDVVAMGGGNKDIDTIMEMDPHGEYVTIAESDPLPGDPVIMRGTLPAECQTALRSVLSEHADSLWEALIATDRNEDKFLNRDSSMVFDLTPADYDVVKQAYASAGIEIE